MEWEQANEIAQQLVEQLRPGCERIEVGGSLRRKKPQVKDIEIVCIPKVEKEQPKLFDDGRFDRVQTIRLNEIIREMVDERIILRGWANGQRYKQLLILGNNPITVDLFICLRPAQWGVILAIRTGPADLSHWLVTSREYHGGLPAGYAMHDGALWQQMRKPDEMLGHLDRIEEELMEMAEEKDFFEAIGAEVPLDPTLREQFAVKIWYRR